jgi:hypothetical protein
MKTSINIRRVMKDSFRLYFAPLTGAFKGVRAEFRRGDREIAKRIGEDSKLKRPNHA